MARIGSKPIDEMIRLAMIGDGTAFTALWDTYIDSLKTFIRSKIKNLDEFQVDEICCASFEKAFRHISDYDPSRSQFFTWLCSIAWNTGLDLMDRERRAHPDGGTVYIDDDTRPSGMVEEIPDQVDSALDSIIKLEDSEETSLYINRLPDIYRFIARRRFLDGLQYKAIASEMGLELNTVRTRIRRAKQMIDKMKQSEEKEE